MAGNAAPTSYVSRAIDEGFEAVVLPHLGAARRLARWLIRNDSDADDAVQEASLRALRYFRTFTGGNGRAWFLRIVRNTCHGWRRRHVRDAADTFDEERHSRPQSAGDPEAQLLRSDAAAVIHDALGHLPARLRELLILREFEGMSYREIADVMDVPIGTVMSGLSRARQAFRIFLNANLKPSGVSASATPLDDQEPDAELEYSAAPAD